MLARARAEIWKSWRETCALNKGHPQAAELFNPDQLPAFHDPFAGGGALPLEAQRLGLEAWASDLNPVAVTINKAMIEIPPRFANRPPVGPRIPGDKQSKLVEDWSGAKGLAEDVRRYGAWMRAEAEKRIGHLYPKIEITAEMVAERPDLKPLLGQNLTVIAWLWARTVRSPNPAFSHAEVPLASTFVLSNKVGKEAYVEPVVEGDRYRFTVKVGTPPEGAKNGTKLARGAKFFCIFSNSPIDPKYIKSQAAAGKLGRKLLAVAVDSKIGRLYVSPNDEHEIAANSAHPSWRPEVPISGSTQYLGVKPYGMHQFDQLFLDRQLLALTTFSNLVEESIEKIKKDALMGGWSDDNIPLIEMGLGARGYAEAVAIFLTFAVDYAVNYWSTLTTPADGFIRGTFSMQALPMSWDFAEAPPFGSTSGNWMAGIDWISKALKLLPAFGSGYVKQMDACSQTLSRLKVVSTDPPYFDNVPYADLSDYFYVWVVP